ncbi:MAG: stage II sporulation protein R [Bacilli bacterium]|jgi:stage II sporulation protein R
MKKTFTISLIILSLFFLGKTKEEEDFIPNEAIRLRVIANSNSQHDQRIKMKVKDKVQTDVYNLLENVNEITTAKTIIKNNLNYFNNNLTMFLKNENYNLNHKIVYENHFFKNKKEKGINYKEGNYEAVVVTLGKGKGSNWWCILFPPLCLLEAKESSDIEYKFFIKELLKKYLN